MKQCYHVVWRVEKKNNNKKTTKNPKIAKARNGRAMLLSKCAMCDSKKSKFMKEEEASWLLSGFGIKTRLSDTLLLGSLLF